MDKRIVIAGISLMVIAGVEASGQEPAVTKIDVLSLPSRSRELRLLRSFPTEQDEAKEVYFAQAQYLSADDRGRIYVSDVKANQVLIFEKDGRFVMRIGRTGQGPGEFNLVGRALPNGRGLAVLDRSNHRVQYFDDRGLFADSLKFAKSCGDMAIGTDGTVYTLSVPNAAGELVSAIDAEGRVKVTFGQPPRSLLDKLSFRACWPRIGPGNELFIAFWFYPFIQVYSPEGKLRNVFELRYRPIQERLAKNEARAKTVPGGGRVIGEAVIEAIDVDENGFYVLYRGKRIEILEFKRDGTFVRTYWTAQAPDYYPRGLLVLDDGGRKAFYLLQAMPDIRIDVFVEK
jgi:6-bladed beta-propeller